MAEADVAVAEAEGALAAADVAEPFAPPEVGSAAEAAAATVAAAVAEAATSAARCRSWS